MPNAPPSVVESGSVAGGWKTISLAREALQNALREALESREPQPSLVEVSRAVRKLDWLVAARNMTADLLLPAALWGPPNHEFLAAIVETIVLFPSISEPTLAVEANDFATAVTLTDLGISEITWQPLLPSLQSPPDNWIALATWAESTSALASPNILRHLDLDVTSRAQHLLRGLSLALLEQRLLSAAHLARWVALANLSDQEDSLFQTALAHIRVLSTDSATLVQVAAADVTRCMRRG